MHGATRIAERLIMRMKLIGTILGVLGWSAVASAQFQNPYGQQGGGGGASPFAPNPYNPQTQPLSPYLNSRGSGNPAANYYFGTRPGTVGGAGGGFGGAPNIAFGGNRGPFPFQYAPDELGPAGEPAEGYVLPPAGHPVVFSNTLGYYPSPFGNNRNGNRNGLQGVGSNRPGGGGGQQQQGPMPKR